MVEDMGAYASRRDGTRPSVFDIDNGEVWFEDSDFGCVWTISLLVS